MSRVTTVGETISGYGDRNGGSLDIISDAASRINVTGYDKDDVFYIDATAIDGRYLDILITDDGGANDITVISTGAYDTASTRVERTDWGEFGVTFSDAPTTIRLTTTTANGAASNFAEGWDGADRIIARATTGSYGEASNQLYGGSGDDNITAYATVGRPAVEFTAGFAASNYIDGGEGNDRLESRISVLGELDPVGTLANIEGGAGDDRIISRIHSWSDFGAANPTSELYGGSGEDWITANLRIGVSAHVGGGSGTNLIYGGDGADKISAKITIEKESGLVAHNELYGGDGDDRISGTIVNIDPGNEELGIPAGGFNEDTFSSLSGGAGNDRLTVRGGEGNILNGGAGNDTLIGGSGSDTLIGLQGDDALQGKGGADIFLFGFIRSGERDRISDFVIGEDVIDLSQIDANRDRAGEQSFRFGTREGPGRAWIEEDPDTTGSILYADDGHRVLEVLLKDGRGVSADDYSASDFLL